MLWRGPGAEPAPPEPWPSRVDAVLTAFALHAAQRERDLAAALEGLAKSSEGS